MDCLNDCDMSQQEKSVKISPKPGSFLPGPSSGERKRSGQKRVIPLIVMQRDCGAGLNIFSNWM